jgi:hemerythrin
MSHLYWTDDLDTGISVIDNQHRRIVDYINQLTDISQSHDQHQLEHVLQELVDYTLSHFAFEESLMEEAGYMFVNGHKKVHDMFTRRVSAFLQRFKLGEDVTEELLVTLRSWLINHIRADDNDYVDAVKANLHIAENGRHESWLKKSVKHFFG